MAALIEGLSVLFADTYALYLKTQNYHWHVKGPLFYSLHSAFENQYRDLAEAVDALAERIVMLGGEVPATFKAIQALKTSSDGKANLESSAMLQDLAQSHEALLKEMKKLMSEAEGRSDEGTVNLLSDRISSHEKMVWMLSQNLSC